MTGDSEFDATTWWPAQRGGELAGCPLRWTRGRLKGLAVREGDRERLGFTVERKEQAWAPSP